MAMPSRLVYPFAKVEFHSGERFFGSDSGEGGRAAPPFVYRKDLAREGQMIAIRNALVVVVTQKL